MPTPTIDSPASIAGQLSSPSDCAVLIALPLTPEMFRSDVESAQSADPKQARGDYAFQMTVRGHGGDIEAAWKRDGEPVANLCQNLISEAYSVGVPFIDEAATAESFTSAATSGASVILVAAHWRSARVTKYDFRSGFHSKMELIGRSASDAFELALRDQVLTAKDIYGRELRESELAEVINKNLLSGGHDEIDDARDELDRRFANCIVPGSCLELRDGYHKAITLSQRLPAEWGGVFDLGVCYSIRLAVALKNGRSDRLVITNEVQKQPDRCLREFRETLLRLYAKPDDYIRVRASVFEIYSLIAKG